MLKEDDSEYDNKSFYNENYFKGQNKRTKDIEAKIAFLDKTCSHKHDKHKHDHSKIVKDKDSKPDFSPMQTNEKKDHDHDKPLTEIGLMDVL